MENLEKSKSKRSVERASFSKLMTKLDSLLADEIETTNVDELLEIQELLLSKEPVLKKLNSEIEDQLSDLKDYEKDIASSEKYNEQFISAKFRIKNRLSKCNKNNISITSSAFDLNCSDNGKEANSSSAMKLPKLNIPNFSGNIEQWTEFFNCFETSIHNNKELSKVEKFAYLKSLLSNHAYSVVEGFPLTEHNYDTCIDLLKDRYGKVDVIINKHMNNLLNLDPVKNSSHLNALRKLHDVCEINIRNLRHLGVTSSSYGHLLNPVLLKLLPHDLVIEYHRRRDPNSESDVTDLIAFLKIEIDCREKALLMTNTKSDTSSFENKNKFENRERKFSNKSYHVNTLNTNINVFCVFCKSNNDHLSSECKGLAEDKKRFMLKKEGRCYRCFLKSHLSSECRVKLQPCEKCNSTEHNKLFCFKKISKPEVSENQTIVSNSHCNLKNTNHAVLLQTCCITAQSGSKSKVVRLLMDSASEKSFIMNKLAHELNLPVLRKEHLTVFAFGMDQGREQEYDVYKIKLRSKINSRRFINVEVLGTDIISAATVKSPNSDPDIVKYVESKRWKLADPSPNESEVQILLGAEYFWNVQRGVVEEINDHLYVTNTIFGYTVVGKINSESNGTINSHFVSVNEKENFDLQCFWNLESLGICDSKNELFSQKDLDALDYFNDNLNFVNGRYETKLLWKVNKSELESNFDVAKRRLWGLKSKLCSNEWLFNEYEKILNEQCNMGIIEECNFNKSDMNVYYMPHRPVIRKDKSTSKVRIVFDASSKDKEAKSLNDCLFSGPNLNPNLLDIILRFRLHQIAFSGDIEKAFLQIQIAEEDRNFLRFLWFDNITSSDPILKVFRMTRVTFGVTTSPFFLSATIKHHIKGYKDLFEKIVNMLDTSLYVDDLFYGAASVNEAFVLSSGAEKILGEANMKLRKFKSNSTDLKKLWKEHGINVEENTHEQNLSKVLGIIWVTENDTLKLDIKPHLVELENKKITKRFVLQTVAKIYDPIGLISPFVIRIKFLMQELWENGIDWDSALPDALTEKFMKWYYEIQDLANFEIPRKYFVNSSNLNLDTAQIFVFCDASLKGYGSVAYIRDPFSCEISFIMSKTRVAPLKKITLPRLELLAALTAARLANYLKRLFRIANENIFCLSDSQIVLYWIKGSASNWKPFVANRVCEIQSLVAPTQWKFCRGMENPADVLSRGCSASTLLNNEIWSHGPNWLKENSLSVFLPETLINLADKEVLQEQRKTIVCSVSREIPEFDLLYKFSSWTKLKRIMAWCLRFIKNTRHPSERLTGFLNVSELEQATNVIVKLIQKPEFGELKILKAGKDLKSNSKLLPLHPFVDRNGILRVGGRLRNANLSEYQKHQILLPKKHHVTNLIINYFHENHLHSGTQLTIFAIRQKFWIINAKEAVKGNIKKCMKCFRTVPNLSSQLMGDLPSARVTQARVFSKVGVDLTGPFMVKPRKGRGVKSSLTSVPDPDISSTCITPLERWKLLQKIFQSFWKRWSCDYLSELQQRTKWLQNKPNLKLNDLVLIKDDNLPPLKWKLGRIIELFPGKDNHVRVVKLKTAHGELKRPITKLSPLPLN